MVTTNAIDPGGSANSSHGSGSRYSAGRLGALVVGATGVVYGDIGTSPLYALRESIAHVPAGTSSEAAVLGIVSLLTWALLLTVTVKYVILLMAADNKGEGGTLSLMALAQGAIGRRTSIIFFLGVVGAALFYGDAVITPAVSVLSAVEGLKLVTPVLSPYILPIALAILVGLFAVQSHGTGSVATLFGPVMLLWFGALALMGLYHIYDDPRIFLALWPTYGMMFLWENGHVGFVVLGSVVLAVTGGEALYADMGHFGKRPIRIAWFSIVLPALLLNYYGQGALILARPEAAANPFFLMVPEGLLLPLVMLATVAAIIASQAVITGAFSLTRQAIQLGLLPRLKIRHTSATEAGQIYMPQVNFLLFVGVVMLVLVFRSSSALASAYGIAVTGSMLVDGLLLYMVAHWLWGWSTRTALLVLAPLTLIDLLFLTANMLKFLEGGYLPLLMGAVLCVLMWTWVTGTRQVREKSRRHSVPIGQLVRMLKKSKPLRVQGTAVFLTGDPESAPSSLLHNLKHNQVLHKNNIILTIRTSVSPRVAPEEQLRIEPLGEGITRIIATVGFMETPDVQKLMERARRQGIPFDIMKTSFFLSRLRFLSDAKQGMPAWQDQLFITLTKMSSDVTDFYHIPSGRVVELGTQLSL
jgi:KUP system potassium uptake protein